MKRGGLALAIVALLGSPARADEAELSRLLLGGDFAAIERQFSAPMQQAVPPGAVAQLFAGLVRERGKLTGCAVIRAGLVQCTVEKLPTVDVFVSFSAGKIVGLQVKDTLVVKDAAPAKTRLRPPFLGSWTASNANLDASSGHFGNAQQRYAVDWLVTDEAGRTFAGDRAQLTSYFSYGKPVVAVAAGEVVVVIDGVPDNALGQMDKYNVGGNQIVVEIAPGEYAYYAHLQRGSAKVKVGARVVAGQPLGLVGNSGNTSEPHLHFQISTKPNLFQAESVPAVFSDVLLDGKRTARARPMSGQRLAPLAEEPR